MRVLVAALVILSASLAFACDDGSVIGVRGSGDLVTEDFDFEDFTKVELASAFRADISTPNVTGVDTSGASSVEPAD